MSLIDTDLSFDPRDPRFPVPGGALTWSVQVFTTGNGYGLRPAEPLVEADRVHLRTGYAALGQQRTVDAGEVEIEVSLSDGVLTWSITAQHAEPIKAVKLLLRGLPQEQLRAGWWTPNTGRSHTHHERFQLEYPGPEWATPWVAVGTESDCSSLSVRDPSVRKHVLHVHQPAHSPEPIVELLHVPAASARGTTCQVPEIRLRANADPVDQDLDEHLRFVEEAHGLVPWESRPDVPDWLRDTSLVVTLHGQHWTGYVFNTFSQMGDALRFIAQHIDPHRVLAYLPGWEGRYYYAYPRYRPGEDLGGADGFAELVRTAHDLGFRLMPMFGGHGANVTQYPDWERAVMRNDTDRYVELLNRPDWDSDRSGEGDQVFLNPAEPGFRTHLVESISALVEEFGVDAAFLDTVGYYFNDPRHDVFDGYRLLVEELHRRHPGLVLAAEGWWDALSALFPLSQQWFGTDRDLRAPRVVSHYARTTGHLAEGTPGRGSTGVHEKGYIPRPPDVVREGHLPVVGVVDDTVALHGDELAAICRWAAANSPR
ncbi:hypothetical protein [Saccharopolyspora dendranthemae]|uniref:Uncharacterized protein n=1 Tax=Saccharopolyspora dendranthemae TaxID=1181886 RepID=A0A561U4R7_9PSEU|nr:hypothetical protein [Saccharopolyspora dendranthemae]TWF94359.1 hypothetical protein FHU35_1360 [Saccharopolyspora dendranthemae]